MRVTLTYISTLPDTSLGIEGNPLEVGMFDEELWNNKYRSYLPQNVIVWASNKPMSS